MAHKRIYFCKGCSAILNQQVKYCPHCGTEQYYVIECRNCGFETGDESLEDCPECNFTLYSDEDKQRDCPKCGYNLDEEGRNLKLTYCNGTDCGLEIGGLIRYSDKTGKPLTVDQIFAVNDYKKELKDWLTCLYEDGPYNTFSRLLFIYDKTGKFKGSNLIDDYKSVFSDYPIHYIPIFEHLSVDKNIDILSKISLRERLSAVKHCLCVLDVKPFEKKTDAHKIIEEYVFDYNPGNESKYFAPFRKISTTFIFTSAKLPEETKLYNIYDKHILIISPELLKSVDIAGLWQGVIKSNE